MKEIQVAYVPRLEKYEYRLVRNNVERVTPSGKFIPLSQWFSGGRDLETAKAKAVEQFGNLTVSVN